MRKAFVTSLFVLAGGVALAAIAFAAPQAGGSGYHLLKKVTLGGEGGWDYLNVDSDSHRVFISHATHVIVVDPEGKTVGDIGNLKGTHGAAVVPEFNHGFTSNGQSNSATMFDLKTLQTIKDIPLPAMGPDGFLYDKASKRMFTFNGRSQDATAVDAKTGEVAGSVPLGGKPEAAAADGEGHIFVNIEDKNQILEFDSKALKAMTTWPTDMCDAPGGLAIDTAHKRLFVGCHNKEMTVVDYTTGKTITAIPIGQGVDSTWFDPGTGYAMSSCGDGTITVAHEDSPDKYTVVDTIMTQNGARTMTVDTKNHNIYTVTAEFGPAPAPTEQNPRPRPQAIPNTFTLLIYTRGKS